MEQQEINSETAQIKNETKKNRPSWPPGQSGNLSGRSPKLPDIEKVLRKGLARRSEDGNTGMEIVITNLVNSAMQGDVTACVKVLDLVYGAKTGN